MDLKRDRKTQENIGMEGEGFTNDVNTAIMCEVLKNNFTILLTDYTPLFKSLE